MSRAKPTKENAAEYVSHSDNDTPVIQITENSRWKMLLAMLLIGMLLVGMLLTYTGLVIALNRGWNIPGITTQIVKEVPVIKEVIKEVPVEKVIEKPVPVYVDRVIEKPVSVPVLPRQIWIDAPGNVPGCFPLFLHLSYNNGESKSYRFDICGRGF